jgi:hypothetical protein
MAGRILNRRQLRQEAERAEELGMDAPVAAPAGKAAPKVKKPRAKKAPPRMRVRWGVFDASMKQVAVFDYNQRTAAEEKLADLRGRNKGLHFLQIVKEPMAEPGAPEEAPAPPAAARGRAAKR